MRKLDSESSTDKSLMSSAIIKSEKPARFSSNNDESISKNNLSSEKENANEKLTISSSSNSELYSDSLENIHQTTEQIATTLAQSDTLLLANQTSNSNDTSSSRNRNSSESSSTSTSSGGGIQLYDVENAMINNNLANIGSHLFY